jgi:RecA/RadA recombinase
MPPTPASKQPYNLDPTFERAVVVLACCRPRFYGRGVHKLEPELLGNEAHKLMLATVRAMVAENGNGPDSAVLVLQRLRRQMNEGKVSYEQVLEIGDVIDAAVDAGLPDEVAALTELAPVLKRRIQHAALLQATHEWANRGDFSSVVQLIDEADRVGIAEEATTGPQLGLGAFDAIDKLRFLERLTTGIPELDSKIDGGLHRGGLGVVVGGTGSGKSMMLAHIACQAWLLGLHVVYATLELPEPLVLARMIANVTGIPINSISGGSQEEAKRRLTEMHQRGGLGHCNVKEFTPHATTIEDLFAWEDHCEQKVGRAVDLQVVDYADKLVAKASGRNKGDHASDYVAMRVVYEGLRVRAVDKSRFAWTASATRRNKTSDGKTGTARRDVDDVADSMHKVRVPDLVVTLNPNDEDRSMEYFVAKHRIGEGRQVAGPVPTDWECGRMCPL